MERNTIEEMKAVIDGIESGKDIEFLRDDNSTWEDTPNRRPDFLHCKYRVKPEQPKKQWRPFKNVDEFLKGAGWLGTIWLKHKKTNYLHLVTCFNDTAIYVTTYGWKRVESLLGYYTFADGTPCGVEEDV